jgi:transcriptional regulator with GAF, ATPase, and Fis domain
MNAELPEEAESLAEAERRLHAYERVIEALRTYSDTLDSGAALQQILDASLRLAQAHQGSLTLLDITADRPAQTLLRDGHGSSRALDHHLNMLLTGWAHRNGKAMWTDQLGETFGATTLPARYAQVASALSVPIRDEGDVIGVINLISLDPLRRFGEWEAHLVSILAAQCAKSLRNARQHEALKEETSRLRREVEGRHTMGGIVGHDLSMQRLFALLERVIPTEGRVLIEGESGTGKELIARVIHFNGPRKEAPFVAIDCGALPANLLESELFGYAKGAFTGANDAKQGLFEAAHKGTLFLDEVANMPVDVQVKFLRAIQEGEVRPLGSTQTRKVDVRIIAASSKPLRDRVNEGAFRTDLYYRLNVVTVAVPALRDRKSDIPVLAAHLLEKKRAIYRSAATGFLPDTLALMERYTWPGNVRELENVVERMLILADPTALQLTPDLLPAEFQPGAPSTSSASDTASLDWNDRISSFEKRTLFEVLSRHAWNQSAAARELGLSESTLRYKLLKLGLRRTEES